MKISFFFLSLLIISSSCTTSKEGQGKSMFETASSISQINLKEETLPTNELSVYDAKTINNPVILSGELKRLKSFNSAEPVLLTMVPVQKEENALTPEQLKTKMVEEMRMAANSTESRFAGWILNKTAKKIESKDFQTKEKLTFFDKVKAKIFGKLQAKYARGGGMSTPDILAIVSLATGVVAFAAFHASFLFGLAAIITGAIALKKGTSRRGMAIAGIVLGAVAILFWSGWLFIF